MPATAAKVTETNALVSIQEQIKSELALMSKSVAPPSGRSISLKGKVFSLPDGTTSQGPISAVILDHRNFNRYYEGAYNPQDIKPPACFALSKELNGMGPHPDADNPKSDNCHDCAMNQWGSAAVGKGKACRNTVRIAIAAPDASPDDEPSIITVSPTGIKSWTSAVNKLGSAGLLPIQTVMEISFDPNQAYPSLVFKPLQAHDKLENMWALREKAQAYLDASPAGA